MTSFATLLDPAISSRYGCGSLHGATFVTDAHPNPPGTAIALEIPECNLQLFLRNGVPTFRDRPRNRGVRQSLAWACRVAGEMGAALILLADTADQVESASKRAARLLPHHQRQAVDSIWIAQAAGPGVN